MTDQKNSIAELPKSSTELAVERTERANERTLLAHERTLMAWVRTAISLISFGFTIYKFFEELSKNEEPQHKLFSPRVVGMVMIGFGLIALTLAQVQHQTAVKKLKKNLPGAQKSISSIIAALVWAFGLILFLGALFRQ